MKRYKLVIKYMLAAVAAVIISSQVYTAFAEEGKSTAVDFQGVVAKLERLISNTPELKSDIEKVLELQVGRSYYWNQKSLDDFITFFKEWVVYNPLPWAGPEYIQPFDELANSEGGEILFNNNIFASWFIEFLNVRGEYLRTPKSLEGGILEGWKSFPEANLSAFKPPKGQKEYLSFNDIFLRVPKKNFTIDGEGNPSVMVSPASGKIHQIYANDIESNFTIKRDVINIRQALNNSPLAEKFIGGQIVDILLWFTDYHYFHSPISGTVVEVGEYAGSYNYNFQNVNWYTALAKHKRTCYVIQTEKFGLVAMIPVGFWGVGSIFTNEEIEVGASVTKGQLMGRFGYGGSSILLVFEPGKIRFSNKNIKKGWESVKPGTEIGVATD